MNRFTFNTLSGLSLLLCAAVCVLWVRSYSYYDAVEFRSNGPYQRWWRHASMAGSILLQSRFLPPEAFRTDRVHAQDREKDIVLISHPAFATGWLTQQSVRWRMGKFAYISEDMGGTGYAPNYVYQGVKIRAVNVPHWAVASLFACLPIICAGRVFRRLRVPPGVCPACGYDLRATPDRCPECGREAKPA